MLRVVILLLLSSTALLGANGQVEPPAGDASGRRRGRARSGRQPAERRDGRDRSDPLLVAHQRRRGPDRRALHAGADVRGARQRGGAGRAGRIAASASSVVQLAPFEVVGGTHPADLRNGSRRYLQYHYTLRIIGPDAIGQDIFLPAFDISLPREQPARRQHRAAGARPDLRAAAARGPRRVTVPAERAGHP